MEAMLNDAFRYEQNNIMHGPNVNAKTFYNMLKLVQQPLYERCRTHRELLQ